MSPQRVAIFDVHGLVRSSLVHLLEEHGHSCPIVTGNPEVFLGTLGTREVDIALVEVVDEPSGSSYARGLELLRELRICHPAVKVVVLTRAAGREPLEFAYQSGVMGFVMKATANQEDVLGALEAAVRGERRFPTDLIAGFGQETERARTSAGAFPELSDREREVLSFIALGHDNLKIGAHMGISERTVKSHVASIYRKLRAENRVQLALRARELGVVARSDSDPTQQVTS